MAVVVFDAADFRERYPKFTDALITDAQLEGMFEMACTFIDNTDSSSIPYDPDEGVLVRKTMLYLATCHMATLSLWPIGQSGPTSNASQGSVSVGYAIPSWTSGQYWNQTPCGQALWLLITRYCMGGRYYAAKTVHPWG